MVPSFIMLQYKSGSKKRKKSKQDLRSHWLSLNSKPAEQKAANLTTVLVLAPGEDKGRQKRPLSILPLLFQITDARCLFLSRKFSFFYHLFALFQINWHVPKRKCRSRRPSQLFQRYFMHMERHLPYILLEYNKVGNLSMQFLQH